MVSKAFDLAGAARQEMLREGFHPDFPPAVGEQLGAIARGPGAPATADVRDLRTLLWSSIDNDSSRDLDQIEFAERAPGGIRLLIGIADVDAVVACGTAIDQHAAQETVTVYTPVHNFPMLPTELSTGLTSLSENEDRRAVVIEMLVGADGSVSSSQIFEALVRNRAQLAYTATGEWLEGRAAAPGKVAASADLQAQLRLQGEAAGLLRERRHRLGALNFDRPEASAVVADGVVQGLGVQEKTRANDLIEDFMVAANEVMARTLKENGVSSIRRVVQKPERWPRIVELAAQRGTTLPAEPDSAALNQFLEACRKAYPVHYADISLAVIKLMGPGEYVMNKAADPGAGHFGLAALDYTHSTAPNRRFSDLVTQRLIKAVLRKQPPPYSDDALEQTARNCTLRESASRKVERVMGKRVAAVAMQSHIGQQFAALVTGVSPKGVFVRVPNPPVEGRLCEGEAGVDVGDQIRVRLTKADPERGFIDFARV